MPDSYRVVKIEAGNSRVKRLPQLPRSTTHPHPLVENGNPPDEQQAFVINTLEHYIVSNDGFDLRQFVDDQENCDLQAHNQQN